jgi:undecaprenyl-diphosphatase
VWRLVVGLSLLAVAVFSLLIFENALLGMRDDVESIQENWPDALVEGMEIALGLPIAFAILGTNAVLLWRRRFRRWLTINVAAFGAIFISAGVSALVLALAPSEALEDAIRDSTNESLGNDGLAAMVAVLTVSTVWIGPRLRGWAIGFVGAGLALTMLGGTLSIATLPFDIGVGIVAGSLAGLVLKTRDRTPTVAELSVALARAGLPVRRAERASVDARGSVPWFVTTTTGEELFVKTLGSDQRAADLLFRLYRALRLRRAGDRRPFLSLRQAVEHEAFLSLAAEARGVQTPRMMAVGDVAADAMLLAYRRLDGRSLDAVDPEEITDRLLAEIWRSAMTLREAGIAHRDLRLANIFVAADGSPWMIDFGFAELAADESLLARDAAELLASTAAVVGPRRAVDVAIGVLGRDGVATALPWIQPLALSSATRTRLGGSAGYAELRAVAADAAGVGDVEYERLERVKLSTVITLASVGLALYVLIPQMTELGGLFEQVKNANFAWLAVAVVASGLTYVGAATALAGAVPVRLPYGSLVLSQLASSFSNRITPAKVGGMATNVRFLQKQDLSLPMATTSVGLSTVAGVPIHLTLLVLFGAISSSEVDIPAPDKRVTIIVAAVILLVSAIVLILPVGRRLMTRYLFPAVRSAWASVGTIARSPAKLLILLGGSAMVTTSYILSMTACLLAFRVDLPIATIAAVYLGGSAVASAAPTPGGIGATEAALIAGYTAVGVDSSVAFAAVMTFRLVTFWLPILPGWFSLVSLQRAGRL